MSAEERIKLATDKSDSFLKELSLHFSPEKLPFKLCYDSEFFPIAYGLEKLLSEDPDALTEFITNSQREEFSFKNPQELHSLRGKETPGSILTTTLSTGAQIITLNTPEANAIPFGRFTSPDLEQSKFQLARFHIGPGAVEDMRMAARQAFQIPVINNLITDEYKGRMGIVLLTREGQLIDPNVGIYKDMGLKIPTTVATISHHTDERVPIFGRVPLIQRVNCEALLQRKLRSVGIFDNTASGMQQTAIVEEILNQFGNNGDNLEHVTIYSPLLTLYASVVISEFAKEKGLKILFVCNGCILGCNPPDRYYSPVTGNPNLCPEPSLLKVSEAARGNLFEIDCARCNWTESLLSDDGPDSKAITDSEKELQMHGYSNQYLLDTSSRVTPAVAMECGVDPSQLLPLSSFVDSQMSYT